MSQTTPPTRPQAPPRSITLIGLADVTLYLSAAASVGAFATALVANLYARFKRRPASIGLVPGVLLLVPGSVGMRALLEDDVIGGLEVAFAGALIGASIVAGLLLANATVRTGQTL